MSGLSRMILNGYGQTLGQVDVQLCEHRVLVSRIQRLDRMSKLRFAVAAPFNQATRSSGQGQEGNE